MTPSKTKRDAKLKTAISRISSELNNQQLSALDGCTVVGLRATICNICSIMQGCAIGIGFYNPGIPADALCNVF
jgi:hypothetical protein